MPSVTEDAIRVLASSQSFERGVDYYRGGALFNLRRVGNELRGYCQGSDYAPYRLRAELGAGDVIDAYCTCPYDWGAIIFAIANIIHPRSEHNDVAIEQVRAVAQADTYVLGHVLLLIGPVLMLWGLVEFDILKVIHSTFKVIIEN